MTDINIHRNIIYYPSNFAGGFRNTYLIIYIYIVEKVQGHYCYMTQQIIGYAQLNVYVDVLLLALIHCQKVKKILIERDDEFRII